MWRSPGRFGIIRVDEVADKENTMNDDAGLFSDLRVVEEFLRSPKVENQLYLQW